MNSRSSFTEQQSLKPGVTSAAKLVAANQKKGSSHLASNVSLPQDVLDDSIFVRPGAQTSSILKSNRSISMNSDDFIYTQKQDALAKENLTSSQVLAGEEKVDDDNWK